MTTGTTHRGAGSIIFGSLIALLGVVLLLDNLAFIDAAEVLQFWPVILIVFGVVQIVRRNDTGGKVLGVIVGVIGLWLLLNNLDIVSLSVFALWPLLLVGLGILMLARSSRADLPVAGVEGDTVNAFVTLSGARRATSSKEFQGGNVTAIMGGCEIDLRQADIKGDSAVIDLFVLAGGIEVTVPPGWAVENSVTPLLGGVDDKTARPAGGGKKLAVTGTVIMGGVELKN